MELNERLIAVANILQTMDSNLFQHFKSWFTNIICTDLSKENLDNVVNILENSSPEEVKSMITSNLAKTLRKAQEDAKLQGFEEGIEKGIEQGIEKGIEQGRKLNKIEIAKKMLMRNLPEDAIAEITGFSIEEVRKLALEITIN